MKNTWNDFVKPIVVLGVICLVTSLLLAVTNNVTAPIIAENAVKTANATRQALLPSADTFTEVAPETPTEGVTAIYKADNDSGYVITAQAKGYGGEVPVMVAFNAEGTIEAVQFLDNDETPGLGQKVKSEAFQSQFSGMPPKNSASRHRCHHGRDDFSGAAAWPSTRLSRRIIRKPAWQERTFRPFRPKSCARRCCPTQAPSRLWTSPPTV
ncbi:MAG: FMN-binding protein [Ruthenibacterium lactatiformans]